MPSTLETRSKVEALDEIKISPLAGKPAPRELLVDVNRLDEEYFERRRSMTDRVVKKLGRELREVENVYKIYAESFKSQRHLTAIVSEAQEIANNAMGSSATGTQDPVRL